MTSLRLSALALLLISVSLTRLAQDPGQPPLSIDGAVSRVYKSIGGVELRVHIFNPRSHDTKKATPAIVFFYGGGWTSGQVYQFRPQAMHLAERGMIAALADYRVFARHQTSPFEAMADAKSAIRWLRAHATELGIDATRIAAGGGSSGGHIALSAAVFQQFDEKSEDQRVSSKPDALVLFNPAVDTSRALPTQPRNAVATIQERFGGRGLDASPMQHIAPGLPPMIIVHGRDDTTVPYADVERFCSEVRRVGSSCTLIGYAGAGHGFFNPPHGEWYQETLLETDRFLTQLKYLQPPVPAGIR